MSSLTDKNDIINKNIKNLDKVISNTLEKRIAHVLEKAENMMSADSEEMRVIYEKENDCNGKERYCIEENSKYVSAVCQNISLCDRLYSIENMTPERSMEILSEKKGDYFAADTVVYLKNPLTDIAYTNFSNILSDARVSYKESFSDVCEEVYYSRAPFCILPIENYEDGRLSGFINMIRKYELKIVLTTNVESSNGKITKFALLKRELTKLNCPDKYRHSEYVEIGLNFGNNPKLHKVLESALFFGYNLYKVDSFPVYYSENEYYFDAVFSGNGELEKFISWLELEVPRYEILGIYTHIESK